MNRERTIEQQDLDDLCALRGVKTLLGAILPSGTTVSEEVEARRVAINKWAEENGYNACPEEPQENIASADVVEPQALERSNSDHAKPYSHDSDPLSPANDRWTGDPEMDNAIFAGRVRSVNLFPQS